jgi:D-glycero-D-manno-heptose 1,7-bisphosphate phosphatase
MQPVVKLVILGRDGILNVYRDDHVKSPAEWEPIPGALEAVARLNHAGWHVVVATNQAGIGRGMIDMASVNAIHTAMNQQLWLRWAGASTPCSSARTRPEDHCECRKPLPGLMHEIGRRYGIDLDQIHMVADTVRDLHAAQAAGCQPHLVCSGRAAELDDEQRAQVAAQVPGTRVHADLGAFAHWLLRREDRTVPAPGGPR